MLYIIFFLSEQFFLNLKNVSTNEMFDLKVKVKTSKPKWNQYFDLLDYSSLFFFIDFVKKLNKLAI